MDPESRTLSLWSTYRLLGLAVVLALGVRLYLLWQYYCINSDGVRYVNAARDFFDGRFADGLSSVYPPAYPLLIASLYPLIGDWELSGQIWSLLSGVLLLIPLFVLLKKIYGENVAMVACFLAAVAPYLARYSAHVRTESLFLLLSTLALLVFHQGIERVLLSRFFYGGLVAGLAYLVRPEAIGLLVIVPVTLGILCLIKRKRGILWISGACLLLLLGFSLFAFPYIYYLSLDTGHWGAISRKAGVTLAISVKESGLLGADEVQNFPDLESLTFLHFVSRYPLLYIKKVALDLAPSVGVYFEALHYPYAPFLLVGLFPLIRKRFWERQDLLLLVFLLFYLVGFALIYVNRRYSVQMVPVSLGWTAVGILWCWTYFQKSFSQKVFRGAFSVLAVIFLAATLGKTLKPISPEKAHVREAGLYLKRLGGSEGLKLLVFDDRVAFYAGAKPILLSKLAEGDLRAYLQNGEADYLATEVHPWQERYPMIAKAPEVHGLVLEREFKASGKGRLFVFRISRREKP